MSQGLKVLFLSAEVVPFAKTGGLADVAGALPKALHTLGHDVRLVMPRYGRIDKRKLGLVPEIADLAVPMDSRVEHVAIWRGKVATEVPIYFVDHPRYFDRDGIYGYPDDGERFILYCRAALEMLKELDWQPDVVHCNDWHTGIIPNWLETIYATDPFFSHIASVFTVHNLQYQGVFGHRILEVAGIDQHGFIYHPHIAELANVVDLLARGLLFADVITTVSEQYAREVLTPEYGEGLDPLLRDRQDRLFGILNGIDYHDFDPATDPHVTHYDVDRLDKKVANKLALQREANLPLREDVPVIGMVSRLADQKGFDLLSQIFEDILNTLDIQFVLLGTGDQHYHNMFSGLARRFNKRAAIFLTFNAPLAQKIYSGSDMFLMPSRFEPCGLGQMIALRYGTIPIVRHTGGLADTIVDFDPRTGEGNGFVFERYHRMDLFAAIVRAVENHKHRPTWRSLQQRGMGANFSWDASAAKYAGVYQKAVSFARNTISTTQDAPLAS